MQVEAGKILKGKITGITTINIVSSNTDTMG